MRPGQTGSGIEKDKGQKQVWEGGRENRNKGFREGQYETGWVKEGTKEYWGFSFRPIRPLTS